MSASKEAMLLKMFPHKKAEGFFGSDFAFYDNCEGDGNSSETVLEISGNQWGETRFERLPNGFRLTIVGEIEAQEFLETIPRLS